LYKSPSIDIIHKSKDEYDAVIINAGAYTHYSYAIRDAIEAVSDFIPFVEVHMSDIHKREEFRKLKSELEFYLFRKKDNNSIYMYQNRLEVLRVHQLNYNFP